jgi:pimeloyl-ACP methyl ester carboxylesterase
MSLNRRSLLATTAIAAPASVALGAGDAATPTQPVRYRTVLVDGVEIFFRDAGPRDAPAVLLLHGFPTSSHMFRNLIPRLADRWRVVAPDLPGFGYSAQPDRTAFRYGFEALSRVVERFTEVVGLSRYALYVFDYGAPVGFRLFVRRPERVTAIISQNGNAYEEGLLQAWDPIRRYWADPSDANREALRQILTEEITRYQYEAGVADVSLISPDAWRHDQANLDRPGNAEIQLDLFLDYASNVAAYPAWQRALRTHRPPLLAAWGRNDPFFGPAGAEAFLRDVPLAEIHLLDTGHFALETHHAEIAALMRNFLARSGAGRG